MTMTSLMYTKACGDKMSCLGFSLEYLLLFFFKGREELEASSAVELLSGMSRSLGLIPCAGKFFKN